MRPWLLAPVRRHAPSAVLGLTVGTALLVGFNASALTERLSGTPDGDPTGPELVLVAQVNAARAATGCGALEVDDDLSVAARAYVDVVAEQWPTEFASTRVQTAGRVQALVRAAGYDGTVGHALAVGLPRPEDVVSAWRSRAVAPEAAALLDDCRWRSVGVGHAPVSASGSLAPGVWVLTVGDR
jgi:uncharacterized protein YkwD